MRNTAPTDVSGTPVPITEPPVTEAPLTPAPADEPSTALAAPETVAFVPPAEHCGPVELELDGALTRFDRMGGVFTVPAHVAAHFDARGFTRA